MRIVKDLAQLDWVLAGLTPNHGQYRRLEDIRTVPTLEVLPVRGQVPGSVQGSLRAAGLLPDWNTGLNGRACEWVEHRQWLYQATLPDDWLMPGRRVILRCEGLDYAGEVLLNGVEVAAFQGSFVPHAFDLTPALQPGENRLQILFDLPPRWLGMYNRTSQIHEWKPRFYYTWDWQPRFVQTGIWDAVTLEISDGIEFEELACTTDVDLAAGTGILRVTGRARARGQADGCRVELTLCGEDDAGHPIIQAEMTAAEFGRGPLTWEGLPVRLWWPNGHGGQPLYELRCRLVDATGQVQDEQVRTVGFKSVAWLPCHDAPADADPWLCTVNGQPVFLQGVNWTPIRPNFADVTAEDTRCRLEQYRDLGCNVLRVWGGGVLEREGFYDLCDRLGLLVWQEFPLSSSAYENWPPEDPAAIAELANIAASYIHRRQHHVSLLLWCGGNELQGSLDGAKVGAGRPVTPAHPLIRRLQEVGAEHDPTRRFLPASPSGPRSFGATEEVGAGVHWDVHGPWNRRGELAAWADYWQHDDALFRSEVGMPGASPAALIRHYAGDLPVTPGTEESELWRLASWWIEWPVFVAEVGREPVDLEEYVRWSQARQAEALAIAARACKARFPACGGIIIWMGHDAFPCAANTAILDFNGQPKPAAHALREVFRS